MKRWQIAAAIALPTSVLLLEGGRAAAQDANGLVYYAASTIEMSGRLFDTLLDHWVQGNALTSQGQDLGNVLAFLAVHTVHFLAYLVAMF